MNQLPGFEQDNTYILSRHYDSRHAHGKYRLTDWLTITPSAIAHITGDKRWFDISPEQCLFFDLETTGLYAGSASIFLAGAGYFEKGEFHLLQYFLRSGETEKDLLKALLRLMDRFSAFITFNGERFDVPFVQQRTDYHLLTGHGEETFAHKPHFDLLLPARRLWRRLPSRRLVALEEEILQVERSGKDIPGVEIPGVYRVYLETGQTSGIQRIAYHNEMDVLSMVTLGAYITSTFHEPDVTALPQADIFSLATWYERLGMSDSAKKVYYALLDSGDVEAGMQAIENLLRLVNNPSRINEWVMLQEKQMALIPDNPAPCITLSRFFEVQQNFSKAVFWSERAIAILDKLPAEKDKGLRYMALQHRIKRLKKKC